MKVLPLFYSSREPNYYTWYDENRQREMHTEEKIQLATEGLAKHLSVVDNLDPEDSLSVATYALKTYLGHVGKNIGTRGNKNVSTWSRLRKIIGLRTRLRKLFLNGCHPSIYPEYKEDFTKVKQAVMSSNVLVEELNKSRKQYAAQGL